eukprot:m51a1_g14403 hypothetical protein (98) ;mRNA; f:382167-382627
MPSLRCSAEAERAVGQSGPCTLQLRCADGWTATGQFEESDTLGDVRRFVRASKPDGDARGWALSTAYPRRRLGEGDMGRTLADAGLTGRSILYVEPL